MSKNINGTEVAIKRTKPRYIVINEDIHQALDLYTLSLYMAFRYEADYTQEDSVIKRSAKFLSEKAKISRRQFFLSLNILEDFGLVLRDSTSELNSVSIYHVAQDMNYFNTNCEVVHDMHGVVHHMHTDHYSLSLKDINSKFQNQEPKTVTKKPPSIELRDLINIYREEFPENPQPHKNLISTSLEKTLKGLIKRWPEADPTGNPLTPDAFRRYMQSLKSLAPKFSLGQYLTPSGNPKKNSLETFCRWNTFVKFLEGAYS